MEPYKNPALPLDERVRDLLGRMTTEEKILQTDQYSVTEVCTKTAGGRHDAPDFAKLEALGGSVGSVQLRGASPAVANALQRWAVEKTRLGIPFLFSEEALHGFFDREATCFPQQIGLAGSFEPRLGYEMGRAIATEARAYGVHETFSPVMDLTRDPRYGRVEESYGEDTYLCGEFARETVRGLQGDSLAAPDTVAAEPKHYVGYGTPTAGLNCAPAALGRHDVFAWCLPVFEQAFVAGGAWNTMCSYNAIDGQPVASDHELLTGVLRGQYGMPGFVRSDMTAVARLWGSHHTAADKPEAIAQGLAAGVDLQLYDFTHEEWGEGIRAGLANGKIAPEVLDTACARVLKLKFALGLFENPYVDETLYARVADCEAHRRLALEIARRSACLLKNEGGLLPLQGHKTIAVVGPGAAAPALGDYCTDYRPEHMVTVLDGIREAAPDAEVLYAAGCGYLGEAVIPFHPGWLQDEEGKPGLTGRYYDGLVPQGQPVAVRNDDRIQFNWIYAKPHPALDASEFSVVWTGTLTPPESLCGRIALPGQDSMRLFIDGQLLIDCWGAARTGRRWADFTFTKGESHALRLEFCSDARGAHVVLGYNHGAEDFTAAREAVRRADVAVVCLGDSTETCGENLDRARLTLPGSQQALLKALFDEGAPIVLVLQNGRPLDLSWEQAHIPAILECWYPGEQGGRAIAELLFGKTAPSGRLPMSFPKEVGQVPCNYNRLPGGGVRYVECDWQPLYPFGYGLTYTRFAYSDLVVEGDGLSAAAVEAGETVKVSFTVTNTGERFGEEVAQVYVRDLVASTVKPLWELGAFAKLPLAPGESRCVTLELGARVLRTLSPAYHWRVEPGRFVVAAADNALDLLLQQEFALTE